MTQAEMKLFKGELDILAKEIKISMAEKQTLRALLERAREEIRGSWPHPEGPPSMSAMRERSDELLADIDAALGKEGK